MRCTAPARVCRERGESVSVWGGVVANSSTTHISFGEREEEERAEQRRQLMEEGGAHTLQNIS